jgi:integrase
MQLEFNSQIDRLAFREAISLFHELEGRFKGPNYKYQYKPLIEFFRDRYLDEITKLDVENFRRWVVSEGNKESTANRLHSVLTRMMNFFLECKGMGKVGRYDFTTLALPLVNPGELVGKIDERPFARNLVLTPMEIYKWCDYAHPRIRVITIVALLTLLRRKNIEVLGKEQFNKALEQIHVTQSKTGVPLTIPAQQTVQVIIDDTSYKCQIDFTNYRRLIERARRDTGIHFWLTDLRRTGATNMLMDGVDIRTIQRYLGHTTLVMTERYLQPPVKHMVEASKKIEARFGDALELSGFSTVKKVLDSETN